MFSDGDRLKAMQKQARKHPMRLKILALASKRNRALDSADRRRELPERPAVTVIEYHLKVLREVDLLPSAKPTAAQIDEWLDRR